MFISMSTNNHEIVYEGWLTKSPPLKRIWKAVSTPLKSKILKPIF